VAGFGTSGVKIWILLPQSLLFIPLVFMCVIANRKGCVYRTDCLILCSFI